MGAGTGPQGEDAITRLFSSNDREKIIWKERLVVLTSNELVIAALGASGPEGLEFFENAGYKQLDAASKANLIASRVGGGQALGVCALERLTGIVCGNFSHKVPQEEIAEISRMSTSTQHLKRKGSIIHVGNRYRASGRNLKTQHVEGAGAVQRSPRSTSRTVASSLGFVQDGEHGARVHSEHLDPQIITFFFAPVKGGVPGAGSPTVADLHEPHAFGAKPISLRAGRYSWRP